MLLKSSVDFKVNCTFIQYRDFNECSNIDLFLVAKNMLANSKGAREKKALSF